MKAPTRRRSIRRRRGTQASTERLHGRESPRARRNPRARRAPAAATAQGEQSTGTTTGGGSGADLAAGKSSFTATCGGCHALKDAGTTGNVGPDLDSLAPLTAERVAKQIENGGGPMPPKLLTGQDATNAAAYVASVAGK